MAEPQGDSIFNYTGDSRKLPPPAWALKLTGKLKNLFSSKGAQPQFNPLDSGINATTDDYDKGNYMTSLPTMWRVHNDRKALYQDIERMDGEDEIVSTALDIIADFAISFDENSEATIRFHAKDGPTQEVIDALEARLDLKNEAWQYVRGMVKHGNEMREVIVDTDSLEIVNLKQTISYQIYPKVTERGDKIPGWALMTDKDIYNGTGGKEMEEWQIVPFLYGARRGYLSVPILASARRNWNRLSKIEDGMAIARLTRAYDKLVHRVPVKTEWTKEDIMGAIRKYKDSITKRKLLSAEGLMTQSDSPLDVQTDFFIPDLGDNRGGVNVLNSTNLQLGNLNDVYYSRERMLSRLRVPVTYLQISSAQKTHLKSGTVGDADIQFARMIRGIHANLRRALKRVIDLQLTLKGIDPRAAYTIEFPEVETDNLLDNARIQLTMAQAAAYFVESFGVLPPELIAKLFMDLDPDSQKIMDKFLAANADKIVKARMTALAAPPRAPASLNPASASGGSGNNNKSKTSRSSEQKGQKQSLEPVVTLEEATDVFMKLHQAANDELRQIEGIGEHIQDIDESFRDVVRQNLADIAIGDAVLDGSFE